jgi:hypothetical protein
MMRNVRDCVCGALVAAVLLGAAQALGDVTLGPGETLNWASSAPASTETITATGGTIVFDSDATVQNNFYLGGEVTVEINNGAKVRFAKTFFQTDPSGRLVLSGSAQFGSTDSGKFAFLPENSIAFSSSAVDPSLELIGYVSLLALLDKWSSPIPHTLANNLLLCFYGGYMVTDPVYTVPAKRTVRMTSPTNFPATTIINVPATATFQNRPAKFNFSTSAGESVDNNTTTVRSNNVVLAGGTFQIMTGSTHNFWGNISGTGTVSVGNAWPNDGARNCYHYFYGDISGLDAQSQLTIEQVRNVSVNMNNGARLNSSFPGTVKINFNTGTWLGEDGRTNIANDVVSFGFAVPGGSGSTNEYWNVGALQGGSLIGQRNGEGGARLQFTAKHHIHVGTLSGKLALFATGATDRLNSNDLTVDTVADDTIIYVKNGLRLHFGTVGKGVKIRYMADPLSSNVVEVASGTIEEITFLANLRSKPVYLHGNVGFVGGPGKVIASDGSRVGFVGAEAEVVVNSGSVALGDVALGDEELFGSKPALWVDASDLSTYAPLYKSSYHNNGTRHAPSTLLGADKPANVYTNDFPLIEKWYDKRPEQRLNFFWNDRWKYDDGTFYPQFYPYIVPNGLNGKPILSFGIHREAGSNGLSSEWTHVGSPGSANGSENRRMHLMQNPPTGVVAEGHAVYVHSCVMVFGSERGGGRCILGGYKGNAGTAIDGTHNPQCGDHFLRTGSGYGVENGIFQAKIEGSGKNATTNLYETWVNGTSVICTNTPMSGSWDVISFHTDKAGDTGRAFRNIGCPDDTNQSGGQDYAEFLVYSNKLTTAERLIVENYLASKWGLTGKQAANAGTVTLGAGGALVGSLPNIAGSGTWTLGANDYAVLDGSFTGTIGGTGHLTAPTGAQAPKLASSFAGSLTMSGGNLSFTYANGAFAPALVAKDADMAFPSAPTVTISTCGATLLPGDYPLVSGKTLTGLTDCTLSHDIGHGMKAKLVRTETSLVLRVMPSGITVIFR